jgi:hypothetical protein
MSLTPDQVEAAATAPQSATVDGNSATARSAADLIALANYADQKRAQATGRPPIKFYKLIPPGTVGGRSCRGFY